MRIGIDASAGRPNTLLAAKSAGPSNAPDAASPADSHKAGLTAVIAAVRAGVGRETAHEVIKEHAVAVALAMRERGAEPDLLDRLAADPRLPLVRAALDAALADRAAFTGAAASQVDQVIAAVDELVSAYPDAAKYTPGAIL